jgi:hypothetical protein
MRDIRLLFPVSLIFVKPVEWLLDITGSHMSPSNQLHHRCINISRKTDGNKIEKQNNKFFENRNVWNSEVKMPLPAILPRTIK